ncbi:MAG: hypothetical protein HYV19_02740 [Gemmatimonadetes bacterium]|nr:hypothetical protein [Gemmatimonadota bacterium]
MRILRLAILLAVSAAGASAQAAQPLEASLRRGVSEPSFFVDQPAYVAVFEVIPGQGVLQLFPRSTSQASKPVEPGEYLLSRPFRSTYQYAGWNHGTMPVARPMWMVDNRGRIISYYYTTGWTGTEAGWGAATIAPTRTLLLVASRRQLRRVASADAASHWLQQVVGFRAIASTIIAPTAMLDDIVEAVLPVGSAEDDVVVDVLELTDSDPAFSRYAGQSISFYCPTGTYNIPAEYFFASGVFYCPMRHPLLDSPPATPSAPVDTTSVKVEQVAPVRKVPLKYQVDEAAVPYRRGVIATPTTVTQPVEGYQPYRRGVGTTDVSPRGTIVVGVPVDPTGLARTGVTPTAEAWTPRGVRTVPFDNGGGRYGNDRPYTPSTQTRSESYRPASTSIGTTTTATSTTTSSPSTASADQAARSAASREAINAARPAATKPNPDPKP